MYALSDIALLEGDNLGVFAVWMWLYAFEIKVVLPELLANQNSPRLRCNIGD